MKIAVSKTGNNQFRLELGHTQVQVERVDLMKLAMAIDDTLFPVAPSERGGVDLQAYRLHLDRLRYCDDPGLRSLLREITPPQLQLLVRLSEGSPELHRKLQMNLPQRTWDMLVSDAESRFARPVTLVELHEAVEGIMSAAGGLAQRGELTFNEPGDQEVRI